VAKLFGNDLATNAVLSEGVGDGASSRDEVREGRSSVLERIDLMYE
jgi:hypothetical protein